MISIVGFDEMLAPDVKRGRVKHPRWFRQKCQLSPEASLLLASEDGPALFGIWCLLQQWAMRHPKRGGCFATLGGSPMTVEEIAMLIGVPGREHLVRATIKRVTRLGWMTDHDESMGNPRGIHGESAGNPQGIHGESNDPPESLQENSTLEERRGEEKRGESRENVSEGKILRETADLMASWKGSPLGILEARVIASVVQEATESPVGDNCPQEACAALLRHAVGSGVDYSGPAAAKVYLDRLLNQWRIDGEIPSKLQT